MHAPITVFAAVLAKARPIAERLLRRESEIADDLRLIDEDKDALRALAEEAGEGFRFEVEGLGSVEIKAGHAGALTGTSPQLVIAAFLALSEKKRQGHIDRGLVKIVNVWKKAAKPSVTVRL